MNVPQADGATALHWAVFRSDKEMVDLLLHAGANAKAANRDGSTPLWLASVNGDAAIVAALLNAGADANEKLPLGRTPLMEASRTGNVDAMKVLLDHGADVNAKENLRGTTALMWAADEGHAAAIQLLIQRGADIKATSSLVERGRGPALGKSNDPRKASRHRARRWLPEARLISATSRLCAAIRTVSPGAPGVDAARQLRRQLPLRAAGAVPAAVQEQARHRRSMRRVSSMRPRSRQVLSGAGRLRPKMAVV